MRLWLEAWDCPEESAEIERLDLDQYLRDTGHIELLPEERLRRLAIELEGSSDCDRGLRNWAAIDRVYERAIRLSPRDAWVHASQGITATEFATVMDPTTDAAAIAKLHRRARSSLLHAAELDPEDGQLAYCLGYSVHADPSCSPEEPLAYFDRALSLEPRHAWASLYRAHCLHDLGRWKEAVDAYSAVPADGLQGPGSWRLDLLIQQRGACRLEAGDSEGALADFECILSRYEKRNQLDLWCKLDYVKKAAEEHLPQLRDRVRALEERIDDESW